MEREDRNALRNNRRIRVAETFSRDLFSGRYLGKISGLWERRKYEQIYFCDFYMRILRWMA